MNLPKNQTCPLPDGRRLGYALFGHPNGTPLLLFHGFPMSRLDGWQLDKIARRRRIRVIAPDRPGFGLSTLQAHRRIIDWPADVRVLMHHLGIARFAVLGISGGGPYALACAHELPSETLSAVGVMCGAPPWIAGAHYMPWFSRLLAWGVNYCPAVVRLVSLALVGLARWVATLGPVTNALDTWLDGLRKKRKEEEETSGLMETRQETEQQKEDDDEDQDTGAVTELPIPEHRQRFIACLFEGFAQGPAGFVQEAALLSALSWGFRFEDVAYDEIHVWHGSKDYNAPVEMIRYMAKRLRHCDLQEFKDDNHASIANRLPDILDELIQPRNARHS